MAKRFHAVSACPIERRGDSRNKRFYPGSAEKNRGNDKTIIMDSEIPDQLIRYCLSVTREPRELRKAGNASGYYIGVLKNECQRLGFHPRIEFRS